FSSQLPHQDLRQILRRHSADLCALAAVGRPNRHHAAIDAPRTIPVLIAEIVPRYKFAHRVFLYVEAPQRRPAAGQAALNALGQRGGKYFQTERSRPRNLRLFSINEYPADTVRLARENKSFASIHKSQHSRVT